MAGNQRLNIAVLAGDGIGPEVTGPCLEVVQAAVAGTGLEVDFRESEAGVGCYRRHGDALPAATLDAARAADAVLLAAMGDPSIRYPDGTEIAPQIDLRFDLGLYAGVRPVRSVPGLPSALADPRANALDFVIIRESTEGLFASHGRGEVIDDQEARETLVITRATSERLFDFAFALATRRSEAGRPGQVTCVDKANVFRAFAFFRKVFDERAVNHTAVAADHAYVDAVALDLVRRPWRFDVMVTENMFGDILSDLGAGLIGGMGMAPSADIGDDHAVFQPCHGSAPDIAGQGKANPTAMFLSAAMMLDWLALRHELPAAKRAAGRIRGAVDRAFGGGRLLPTELGGDAGTTRITEAVLATIGEVEVVDTVAI
ncbi:MAG: isocitrate/isopropylmalate family dehydrogenase [Pseudomonadota bacterium]